MTVTEADLKGEARKAILPAHVKGLIYREWLAHRPFIIWTLAIYLVLGWVLLVFFHAAMVVALGLIFAAIAARSIGGQDTDEGSEEFAFSLPPTRGERYLVRLALGGGAVILLTGLGTLSIALDLPQRAWGLFVETGFTEPFPRIPDMPHLYWLAVALPFALFAFSFVIASLARTRGTARWSWFLGFLCAGAVGLMAAFIEDLIWRGTVGFVQVPAFFILGALALAGGYLLYRRKEGIARPAPMARGGWGWWVALVIVGVVLLLFFALFWAGASYVERPSVPAQPSTDGGR